MGCLALFFLVFFLAGAAALYFMVLRPARGLLASRSWVETPCVVQASRVGESSDSDGTTYRVEVEYTYSLQGREYRSSRYNFLDFYSSGYDGKAEVVARYPPGTRTVCYVDPDDPSQAVIDRKLSWAWLVGLVPLLFIAVGGGGLIAVIWSAFKGSGATRRQKTGAAAAALQSTLPPGRAAAGPVTLSAKATPFGTFVAVLERDRLGLPLEGRRGVADRERGWLPDRLPGAVLAGGARSDLRDLPAIPCPVQSSPDRDRGARPAGAGRVGPPAVAFQGADRKGDPFPDPA
jgi:hypothetical protein